MTFSVLVAEIPLEVENRDIMANGFVTANSTAFDSPEYQVAKQSDIGTTVPLHPMFRRTSSTSTSHSRSKPGTNEHPMSTQRRRPQPLVKEEETVIEISSSDDEAAQFLRPTASAKRNHVDEKLEAEDEAALSVEDERLGSAIETVGSVE